MNIYKTTNLINNKIYIGQELKYNKEYFGSGTLIKRAIKKYGKDNLKKEILRICKSQIQLDVFEAFYIKKFNSCDRKIGYNILTGTANKFGSGSPMLIEEVRKRCSKSNKRFWKKKNKKDDWSIKCKKLYEDKPEIKDKISKSIKELKLIGSKNPNFGNKWSDEKKKSMSDLKKKQNQSGENNPNYGKKWTPEMKQKSRDRMRGKYKGESNPNYKHGKNIQKD